MRSEFRFRLLALGLSFLFPVLLSLAVPRLDLYLYDTFQVYYEALCVNFREVLGPPPILHTSLVLLGERETRDLDKGTRALLHGAWGAEQDLSIAGRLLAGGARAVVFQRDYSDAEKQSISASLLPRAILPVKAGAAPPVDLKEQKEPNQEIWSFPDDADQFVRRFYVAVRDSKSVRLVPTLPLVLYADYLGLPLADIHFSNTAVQLGNHKIAVQDDGVGLACLAELYDVRAQADSDDSYQNQALGFPVQLQTLLTPDHPLFEKAAGRYFFIGNFQYTPDRIVTTPRGSYRDFQLLAVALDTLIHGRAIHTYRGPVLWGWWLALDVLLGWFILGQATAFRLALRTSACMVALVCGEMALLRSGFYLAFSGPALGVCLLAGLSGLRLWVSAVHLITRFGGRAAALGAQWGLERDRLGDIDERDATILFINLPDYFKNLERLGSANLFERRKAFSALVAGVSHRLGGIIHDYQADALMIGFGTDVLHRDPLHAVRAVEAARRLEEGFQELSKSWPDAAGDQVRLYAGICSGDVAVGYVGAEHHKKSPAAIGDTTNVAARLLGAARKLDVDILISKATYLGCQRWVEGEELPPVPLKGKTHPVEIYAVRRIEWREDGDV